jgi:hypothetical protein
MTLSTVIFLAIVLPNFNLILVKKFLKTAKIIDESLIQLFYVTILLNQVISFNSNVG